MRHFLGIPAVIWIGQLAYVVVALALLTVLLKNIKPANKTQFIGLYVIAMVALNVMWRIAVSRFLR
jgi:hypothetical protein